MKDPTNSIGVGVCARGRIGIVTGLGRHRDGRTIYKGIDIFGNPWQTVCIRPVSWKEITNKLKWRLSQ